MDADNRFSSEKEFLKFIRSLPDKENCPFKSGLDLDLCKNDKYDCPFRGEETYSLRSGTMKECRRSRILHIRKILGR